MAKLGKRTDQELVKQVALDLPVGFVLMLDSFCDAAWGAPRAKIIREAVTEFVRKELEKNPGLQERFAEAERRRKERFSNVVPMTPKPTGED